MNINVNNAYLFSTNAEVEIADKETGDQYTIFAGRADNVYYRLDTNAERIMLPEILLSSAEDVDIFVVEQTSDGDIDICDISICIETSVYNEETDDYDDITMPTGYAPASWTGVSYSWAQYKDIRDGYEDLYIDNNRIASYDEAVGCAIDERRKFITEIDDGIKVHAEGDETSYLKIDNDSVDVYVDETLATTFGLTKIYNDSIATPTPVLKDVRPSMVGNGKLFVTNKAMSEHPDSFVYLNNDTALIGAYHSTYFAPGTEPSGTRYNFAGIEAKAGKNNLTELNLYGAVKVNGIALNGRESAKSEWFTANGNGTITNRCTYNPIINAFIVNLVVVLPNATAGAWQKVGTVAEGYRPPYAMALSAAHNIATSNANTHGVYAFINTSGEVYVKRTTSTSSSFTTYVTGMYFI